MIIYHSTAQGNRTKKILIWWHNIVFPIFSVGLESSNWQPSLPYNFSGHLRELFMKAASSTYWKLFHVPRCPLVRTFTIATFHRWLINSTPHYTTRGQRANFNINNQPNRLLNCQSNILKYRTRHCPECSRKIRLENVRVFTVTVM